MTWHLRRKLKWKPPTNQDTSRNLPLAEGVIYIGYTGNFKCASSAEVVCCRFLSHLKLSLYLTEFCFQAMKNKAFRKHRFWWIGHASMSLNSQSTSDNKIIRKLHVRLVIKEQIYYPHPKVLMVSAQRPCESPVSRWKSIFFGPEIK